MPMTKWRPASEAEAAGAPAVFIAWLRAVHGIPLAGPAALAEWRRDQPAAFARAMADFAGLPSGRDIRHALLHGNGARPAWIDGEKICSRAELLAAAAWPAPLARMLAGLALKDLPMLAASHMLDHGTVPDTRLIWSGDADEPWPLGVWLVGAALARAPPGEALGMAGVRAAPPGWRG